MTAQEIRKMTDEEIIEKIKEGKSELLNMRMQKMSMMKKDIARMMTILKERELQKGGNK